MRESAVSVFDKFMIEMLAWKRANMEIRRKSVRVESRSESLKRGQIQDQACAMGTGVGGASDLVKNWLVKIWYAIAPGLGNGAILPKTTRAVSDFLSTLIVVGTFSSCFLASAILLHIEHGASPLKVFFAPAKKPTS